MGGRERPERNKRKISSFIDFFSTVVSAGGAQWSVCVFTRSDFRTHNDGDADTPSLFVELFRSTLNSLYLSFRRDFFFFFFFFCTGNGIYS